MRPILIGAVVHEPRVPVVWELMVEVFRAEGCPIDTVFYTNYELQVEALLARHIDIAWNSPLAWIDAQRRTANTCRALAMRDTDRDRVSHILAPLDGGIRTLKDLRGKTLATGACDSPQATLLPIHFLHEQGLRPGADFKVQRFDLYLGKHGDQPAGERAALESLQKGESDACAVLDLNWERWSHDGTVDPRRLRIVGSTGRFDRSNFTVLRRFRPDRAEEWTRVLYAMSYENPAHREIMNMQGLTAWLPGRTTGYGDLAAAVRQQNYFPEAAE